MFIHGCFWHRHTCRLARLLNPRQEFWGPKLESNRIRDEPSLATLESQGRAVLVMRECELGYEEALAARIAGFLDGKKR